MSSHHRQRNLSTWTVCVLSLTILFPGIFTTSKLGTTSIEGVKDNEDLVFSGEIVLIESQKKDRIPGENFSIFKVCILYLKLKLQLKVQKKIQFVHVFSMDSLQKMSRGFSHVFLTAVWSKMSLNPMEIPSFS